MDIRSFKKHYERLTARINWLVGLLMYLECSTSHDKSSVGVITNIYLYRRKLSIYKKMRKSLVEYLRTEIPELGE